jgi:hypothetical protein
LGGTSWNYSRNTTLGGTWWDYPVSVITFIRYAQSQFL